MTYSSRAKLFAIFVILVAAVVPGGIYLAERYEHNNSTRRPPVKLKTQPNEKVSYDNERKCNVLDLEPGRKLLSCNVFAGSLTGEYHIFYATRAMHTDESVEPDIMVKFARDEGQPEIGCAYIIREHALPAPVVSK